MPEEATDQPESAQAAAVRGLLDLPGEIRNRIYDYIAVEDTIQIRQLCGSEINNRLPRPMLGLAPFALSHVCRTLRAELRPLLIVRTTFSINWADINAVIDCFILTPATDVRDAVGQVVINTSWEDCTFDIKPLLQLLVVARGVSVIFKRCGFEMFLDSHAAERHRGDRTLQELLRELLGIYDEAKFLEFTERAIDSMMLTLTPCKSGLIWITELDLKLPEQQWKPWMRHWSSSIELSPVDFDQTRRDVLKEIQDWNVGMNLRYHGNFVSAWYVKFSRKGHWHERLTKLSWNTAEM